MVLVFRWGRLAGIEPADGHAARWLQETQIGPAKATGDLNWANLAEIGIGLNPSVERLTGNMLFDEKAAGTAHVALGDNTFMGGVVQASIHCDMVTKGPTVLIDGKTIVDRGKLRYVSSEWHPHHSEVSLADGPLHTAELVARSGVQASGAADGHLQRVLRPEPGRVSACFVGDPPTARLANTLYGFVPDEGDWLSLQELGVKARMEPELVCRVLHILWEYDLVKFR
jgi:hypothetical protein